MSYNIPDNFSKKQVCTPEDEEIISRGTKKGEKLKQYLMKNANHGVDNSGHEPLPHSLAKSQQGMAKALKHRDKLLEFDKNRYVFTENDINLVKSECSKVDHYFINGF